MQSSAHHGHQPSPAPQRQLLCPEHTAWLVGTGGHGGKSVSPIAKRAVLIYLAVRFIARLSLHEKLGSGRRGVSSVGAQIDRGQVSGVCSIKTPGITFIYKQEKLPHIAPPNLL